MTDKHVRGWMEGDDQSVSEASVLAILAEYLRVCMCVYLYLCMLTSSTQMVCVSGEKLSEIHPAEEK